MTQRQPKLAYFVGIGFSLLFTLLAILQPGPVMSLELFLYDLAMNVTAPAKEIPNPIVIIEIDEKSSRRLGPWPWPRQLLAEMVTSLRNGGAKVIGLHLPLAGKESAWVMKELTAFREKFNAYSFSRKDDGPRSWVLENLKEVEERVDSDRMLVERTKLAGNVVCPIFVGLGRKEAEPQENDPALLKNTIANGGLSLGDDRVRLISAPFPDLAQTALGLGHAGLSFKKGMEGRSHPPFVLYNGRLMPSFPLRMAIALLGQGLNQLEVEGSRAKFVNSTIPLWEGEILVDFRGSAKPLDRYSFVEALEDRKVLAATAGKIVLIGFNLDETQKVSSPLSSSMPLVEFQAHVIQTLLSGQAIHRPSFMIAVELGATWILSLIVVVLFGRSGRWRRLAGTAGLLASVLGFGLFLFSHGIWLRTGMTAASLAAVYTTLLSVSFLTAGKGSETYGLSRELGVKLQGQGFLDQALEHFRTLPLDQDAMELIYQLGLEYEGRGMIQKALGAYEIVQSGGKFRDLDDRMSRLRSLGSGPFAESRAEESKEPENEPGEFIARVARYEIIQELGKGSMGFVYKARDPRINRMLAIKTIRFSDDFDSEIVQDVKSRFFKEAEIAGRLSHPSIVTVYDVGEDRDLTYMVMEYLEGNDLERFVTKGHLLPFRRVLEVVASVADALDYAHKAGVIHRDIKPANIMLLKQGGVKVTDFGIAKAVSSSRTRTGVILGTPNYMSPEQIMGQKIDHRTDIFSLGVLLFQCVTGKLPFHGENLSTLLYQITQVKHPSVKEFAPKLPRACEQIIDKALAKDPDRRFASAGEVGRLARLIITKMDEIKKAGPA